MRVLLDGRMFRGRMHGLARYVYSTVRAMALQEPEWVFGVLEREGAWADLAGRLPNVEPVPVRADPFSLAEHLELPRRISEWHPALFHAPTLAVPLGVRGRLVVTVPDLTPYHFPRRGLERLYFRGILAPSLRRARRVLVYSEHTARDLVAHLGVPRERITVSPLGVDPALGGPLAPGRLEALREQLGLGTPYVLCLSNPKPHKNVGVLLEAWARLGPRAELVLVCARSGWLDRALEGLGRVRRLDHVPEEALPALYQGARVLVLPSLYEGFGLPVAEAMAAGTPVLAARAASLPELVGEDGLLFDPRDPDDLARSLERLLSDEPLGLELSRRGRERARRWTWEETARVHLATYRSAVR